MRRIKFRNKVPFTLGYLELDGRRIIENQKTFAKSVGITQSVLSRLLTCSGIGWKAVSSDVRKAIEREITLSIQNAGIDDNDAINAVITIFNERFNTFGDFDLKAAVARENNFLNRSSQSRPSVEADLSFYTREENIDQPANLLLQKRRYTFIAVLVAAVLFLAGVLILRQPASNNHLSPQAKPTMLVYLQPPTSQYAVDTNKMIRFEIETTQKKFGLSSIEIIEPSPDTLLDSISADKIRVARGADCIIWLDLVQPPSGKRMYAHMIYPNAGYAQQSTVFTISSKDLNDFEKLDRQIKVFNVHLTDFVVSEVLENGNIKLAKRIIQDAYDRSEFAKNNRMLYGREGFIYELEGKFNDALVMLDHTKPVPFPDGVDSAGLTLDDVHRARLLYKLNRFEEAYLCLAPSVKGVLKDHIKIYPDNWACSSKGVIFLLVTTPYSLDTRAVIMHRPRKDILIVIDVPEVNEFVLAFLNNDNKQLLSRIAADLGREPESDLPSGLYFADEESNLSTDSTIKFLPQRIDSLNEIPGW